MGRTMRIGELARRTGLTVRALRFYDEAGLLSPASRTESGHRLYTAADVARLQQVLSLRELGLPLEEVRRCLAGSQLSPLRVVELHLARLRDQLRLQQQLCGRLEGIAARMRSSEEVSLEDLLRAIEETRMIHKYYTPEQLQELEGRAKQLGEEGMRRAEADWADLMAQVQAAMDRGDDPTSEPVRALARRWRGLIDAFTGGNPEIEQSLRTMYERESTVHGMDVQAMRPMMDYIGRALVAEKR